MADLFLWFVGPTFFLAPLNGSWLQATLGIIFLPYATLMNILLWTPGIGLTVLMDVTNGVGHYRPRTEYPGYTPATAA